MRPAELVELREPEALGIFDEHERGVWHVDADLDDRGGDEHLCLAGAEALHHRLLFLGREPAVDQVAAQRREQLAPAPMLGRGGLGLELFGFLDQRADDVRLPPGFQMLAQKFARRRAAFASGRTAVTIFPRFARHLIEHGDIEIAKGSHGQGARDGRGGHDEEIGRGALGLLAELRALHDAEFVLLVDHREAEVATARRLRRAGRACRRRSAGARCGPATRPPCESKSGSMVSSLREPVRRARLMPSGSRSRRKVR